MKTTQLIKLHILALLMTLLPQLVSGQNEQIVDSLMQIIDSTVDDTIKIDALIDLGWEYRHNDFEKAEEFTAEALKLSKVLNRKRDIAASYNLLGIIAQSKDYPSDTVFLIFQMALDQFEDNSDDILKINILNNVASLYKQIGKSDKAFEIYSQGLEVAEAQGQKLTMCLILNNMAVLLKDQGYFEEALPKYKRALKYAEEANRIGYMAALNNNIGLTYGAMQNLDSALHYYNIALEQKREVGNKYSLVTTLNNLASIYISQNKEELSLEYTKEAYEIALNIDYSYGEALSLSTMMEYSDKLENHLASIDYGKKGLEALSAEGDIQLQIFFYERLSENYAKVGLFEKAFENQKLYYAIKDSVYNIESEEKIASLETKYQLQQKEVENKLLKAETKANRALIRKRTWGVIAISLIALLSLIILF